MNKKPIAMGCTACMKKMKEYDAEQLAYMISTRYTLQQMYSQPCGMCTRKMAASSGAWPAYSCETPTRCSYFVCQKCYVRWWREAYNDIGMERQLGPMEDIDVFGMGDQNDNPYEKNTPTLNM